MGESGRISVEEAVYPPYSISSSRLASQLSSGELDRYVELLSINGNALLAAEASDQGVRVEIARRLQPPPGSPASEWGLVESRFRRAAARLVKACGASITERQGFIVVEAAEEVAGCSGADMIAEARRIAGLRPYTGTPLDGLPIGRRSDYGVTTMGTLSYTIIIDFLDSIENAISMVVANGLYYGIGLGDEDEKGFTARDIGAIADHSSSTAAFALRVAERLGVVRRCETRVWAGGVRRRQYYYYVDLRNELVLEWLIPMLSDIVPEAICALLPYLEGATHSEWKLFPGPYKACRSVSETLKRAEGRGLVKPGSGGPCTQDLRADAPAGEPR